MCTRREDGGLGLRRTREMNMAYMMKAGWALCTKQSALWVQVVRSKYKCRDDPIPLINEKRVSSNLWHGICKTWELVNANGECMLDSVASLLPGYAKRAILGIHPPSSLNGSDSLAWGPSKDGEFSVSTAYSSIVSYVPSPRHPIFKAIWKWTGPERVKILLWCVACGALLTNDARHLVPAVEVTMIQCFTWHGIALMPALCGKSQQVCPVSMSFSLLTFFSGCRLILEGEISSRSLGALPLE